MKLIAETAWHHQGDYIFMRNLVSEICQKTDTDIVKMHITLDFDEYMDKAHSAYEMLQPWLFDKRQWAELITIIRDSNKELMLLLNDSAAIEFGLTFSPEYVEIHSVCLNDIFLLDKLKSQLKPETKVVLGVGGTDLYEIDHAITYLDHKNMLLMFGFQNYPTVYQDVNLSKIRKTMKLFDGFDYGYADHTAWDSPHNELVTLLGAASGMRYIEKHVTTHYGEERVDWPAAISIEMFNALSEKVKVLNELEGDGLLEMNQGELSYSVFGPMKKAAIMRIDVAAGDVLSKDKIAFIRTKDISDLSQLDVIKAFGKSFASDVKVGTLLTSGLFSEEEK